MKQTALTLTLILGQFALAQPAAPTTAPDQQLLPLIKEIQAQQAVLESNQAKIDTKLAAVIEAVRVARIYSSRSGK